MQKKSARPESVSAGEIGRHSRLLRLKTVRSWYDERCLRSRLSADSNLRKLGFLLEQIGFDADSIVSAARDDPDGVRDALIAYSARQKAAGRLDTYVLKSFDGLRSYLEHRRVKFEGFPKLSPTRGVSLRSERVPSQAELGQVLERLSLRGRVIALLMAHAGLRPGAIGAYGGANGLRLRDLPELSLSRTPEFREIPFVLRVPAELSKTRCEYTTFGTRQLGSAITAYLSARRGKGERLSPDSPLVAPAESRGVAKSSRAAARFGRGFVTTKVVVEELRGALTSTAPAGVKFRPYVLRAYCATRLLLAEGDGKISRDLREAILGHDGGVASRYHVGKRWGEELLTEARREYSRAASFLETGATAPPEDLKGEVRRILLELAGAKPEEVTRLNSLSDADLLAETRRRLGGNVAHSPGQSAHDGRSEDRLVSSQEAEKLLAAGWTWLGSVGDRAAIRSPSRSL